MGSGAASREVLVRDQRVLHFNAGHTFAHFDFSPANVHRAPHSSMFPPNINQARNVISPGAGGMGPIPDFTGPARPEAHNAARGLPGPTQWFGPDYAIAFAWNSPPWGAHHTHDVQISQFFPTGWSAHEIHEEVLEAIGQLLGHL